MATILAYTSPALGHLLPMSALLSELSGRGHKVHVRTLSRGADIVREFGFAVDAIDPRIETIELGDSDVIANPRVALKRGVASFGRRAVHEVPDLEDAIARVGPDALLVDANCWGAISVADVGDIPWACFLPYTPPLRSSGVPPFGPGLRPLPGGLGRLRDGAVRVAVVGPLEGVMLPPINGIRTDLGLRPVASMDEFLRRSPLVLVASGKPFQYEQTDWGDSVQLIGPCVVDPGPHTVPDWLASINQPIVLVTTSSEKQADTNLARTALVALKEEPVHVVATLPAGRPDDIFSSGNATVLRFVPHGLVLDRAVCAVTHGGMGATQKALARGIPVCVVPYGRDQLEVARRVEVARCGTRLPAKKLSPSRLRTKVREAMTMTQGAERVASGFNATGGTFHGADLFEQRVLGIKRADLSKG